ncbi:restriction endonuclease [Alphaproteobacteria bacterium]|nr:restriction endonuclease [Alphaproteobacteria bacterium]
MTSNSANYLPSTNDFSPGVVDLSFCLDAVRKSLTDNDFKETLRLKYFSEHSQSIPTPSERKTSQLKLAGNVLIGLRNYKLVEFGNLELTEIGMQILGASDCDAKKIFGKHLIDNLCGNEILHAMESLSKRQISKRNKAELSRSLSQLGVKTKQGKLIPENTTDHTKFANWLRWCGILNVNDQINEENHLNFVGKPSGLVSSLWYLTDEQFLFLKYVWQRHISSKQMVFLVKEVISDSQLTLGKFITKPDQIAANILKPLEEHGFFKVVRSSQGRGGNSGSIKINAATTLLEEKDFNLKMSKSSVAKHADKSLAEIFIDLYCEDTGKKGVALEELAIHIGTTLGLTFLKFRERSAETGGAEVDVIFEHIGNAYTKWIVQCKNTPKSIVHVSTIAKEIGNALISHSNVVLFLTTGRFSKPARQFAEITMKKSNLQVMLLDHTDLKGFEKKGNSYLIRKINSINEEISALRAND